MHFLSTMTLACLYGKVSKSPLIPIDCRYVKFIRLGSFESVDGIADLDQISSTTGQTDSDKDPSMTVSHPIIALGPYLT